MGTHTEIRNQRIKNMYDSGMTLVQIAEKERLTKQRVHQIVKKDLDITGFQLNKINMVLFPAIRDWMIGYKITLKSFCEAVAEETNSEVPASCVERFLTTGSKTSIILIQSILKVTGMSFEEAFKE